MIYEVYVWNSEDGFIITEEERNEIETPTFEDWITNTIEQLKNLSYTKYTFEELTPKTNLEAFRNCLIIHRQIWTFMGKYSKETFK